MKLAYRSSFIFLSVAFFAILSCAGTSQKSASQTIYLTEKDSGKPLALSEGQKFTLTLPNKVDGGYRFDKVQYNASVLRMESYTEKSPPPNGALGSHGEAVWRFRALRTGASDLKITASRPWTKVGATVEFENTVTVE